MNPFHKKTVTFFQTLLAVAVVSAAHAQVGVGTKAPKGALRLPRFSHFLDLALCVHRLAAGIVGCTPCSRGVDPHTWTCSTHFDSLSVSILSGRALASLP